MFELCVFQTIDATKLLWISEILEKWSYLLWLISSLVSSCSCDFFVFSNIFDEVWAQYTLRHNHQVTIVLWLCSRSSFSYVAWISSSSVSCFCGVACKSMWLIEPGHVMQERCHLTCQRPNWCLPKFRILETLRLAWTWRILQSWTGCPARLTMASLMVTFYLSSTFYIKEIGACRSGHFTLGLGMHKGLNVAAYLSSYSNSRQLKWTMEFVYM